MGHHGSEGLEPELPDLLPGLVDGLVEDLAVDPAVDPVDPVDPRRELLDLAIAAAGIGTFDLDLVTGTLSWDERLIDLFGYQASTFDQTLEAFNARLHPEDVERVGAQLQQAVDTVGHLSTEYRVLVPDRGQRWLAARGRALADEQGTAVRFLGAAWDITARRLTQDRIAHVVEDMAVGFIAMDADFVMTHVNAEGERIAGVPRGQLLGRTLWEVFPATVGTVFEENYRRAAETGRPVTFDAHHPEPLDVWVEVRVVPGPDGMALYVLDITARQRAQEQAERVSEQERLLGRITGELSGTQDADEAARRLSRLVVPAVADWCIVTLVDDEADAGSRRGLRHVSAWHRDPAMRATVQAYAATRLGALEDDALIVRVLRSGEGEVLDADATARARAMVASGAVRDLLSTLAPEAVAVLPLPGRTGPVGMLTLGNGRARGSWSPGDLATARHVCARAGLVLDNARLYRQQRDLAESFQRSLLTPPPEADHMQIVVRYVPAAQAAEVGGDWYDALRQPGGATVLVIGDVVGHGTAAAAAMGQVRSIVRTLAARDQDGPAAVVREADQVMQTLLTGIVATTVVARLEQSRDERERGLTRLRWSNAGHPPPMVVTPDGQVRVLEAERTDLLLGVDPDRARRETAVTLERDAVVLLYSDGLVERRDQDLDQGLERLRVTLAELAGTDLDTLADGVLSRMLPDQPDDDVALIAVRLHPQDRPRPPEAGRHRVPPGRPVD